MEFKKIENVDKTKYSTFHLNLKAEKIIKESDINDLFESTYSTFISNIQQSLGKGLGWIIDSVIDHNINVSKHNPLDGNNYMKLGKELDLPKKAWLIFRITMIMNALNLCFKWCSQIFTSNRSSSRKN